MRFPSILTESPLPPMGFHDLLWPSTLFSGLSLDIPWGSVTFHSWFFHVSSTGPSWLVFLSPVLLCSVCHAADQNSCRKGLEMLKILLIPFPCVTLPEQSPCYKGH